MARCRGCGMEFQWGFCDGKWIPLEPIATHNGMDRTYVDENGEYRADHRDRHVNGQSVNVMRLEHKVKSTEVLELTDDDTESQRTWLDKVRKRKQTVTEQE